MATPKFPGELQRWALPPPDEGRQRALVYIEPPVRISRSPAYDPMAAPLTSHWIYDPRDMRTVCRHEDACEREFKPADPDFELRPEFKPASKSRWMRRCANNNIIGSPMDRVSVYIDALAHLPAAKIDKGAPQKAKFVIRYGLDGAMTAVGPAGAPTNYEVKIDDPAWNGLLFTLYGGPLFSQIEIWMTCDPLTTTVEDVFGVRLRWAWDRVGVGGGTGAADPFVQKGEGVT